jgi:hypothetical protein
LVKAGKLNESITLFNRVIDLDPNNADGHFLLATAYGSSKLYDMAWKHVRIAEKLGYPPQKIDTQITELRRVSSEH